MDEDAITVARVAEYRQLRRVDRLRDLVFTDPAPEGSADQQMALRSAEAELRRLTHARRAVEHAQDGGLLYFEQGNGLLGPDTTQLDARVMLRMSHVPSGIVHLLDPNTDPLVTYEISFVGQEYARVRLSSWVAGYSATAVDTVELFPQDQPTLINQLPVFFPDRLATVTELTRASLHIRIDNLDQHTEMERSYPIWLLARTTASIGVEDPATGDWHDLGRYLGAWVTPNAAEVLVLLRKAAALHPSQSLVSYQLDKAAVEEQVKAIYDALKAEKIVYINSTLHSGSVPGQYRQRVRLPREVLATRSANCLDGTLSMASLLEAASLNPGIVLVPGHAFLAWETTEDSEEWDYLETTMISTGDFAAAQAVGRQLAETGKALLAETGDTYDFQLLSLSTIRAKFGISPME